MPGSQDRPAETDSAISPAELAEWRDWIGRSRIVTDRIDPAPVRGLGATLDLDPGSVAEGAGQPLPPAWHWLYFHEVRPMSELGRDGHPALGGFLPPVRLPRRMWAGGRIETSQPLQLGEEVVRTSTISSLEAKTGRSGPLVFVTVAHLYEGEHGGRMREEHDIVYRDRPRLNAQTPAAGDAPRADTDGFHKQVMPDTVLLFRYSALTFNGHRIHYDLDFCRNEEGYPGLVVHGPLISTFLLEYPRTVYPRERVGRFSFRAVGPLFHGQPFQVHGRREGAVLKLWAVDAAGNLAMTADAEMTG